MKLQRRSILAAGAASACGLALPAAFGEAAYPNRPIRWIVGTPAGGGSDFVVRTVAEQVSRSLGQQIVVDNRPGGGTTIAADAAVHSAADGYTLLTADTGTIVFNTALFKKLSYTPLRDFESVGMLASFPLLLVTGMNSPFRDARSAIDAIRAKPGSIGYASAGIGSPHHMAMEFLKEQAHLDSPHIPYKGGAPALQDTVAGVVPIAVLDSATAAAMIKGGKLRVLATFTKDRIAMVPDAPTLIELGLTDAEAPCWISVVVPAKTPSATIQRLSDEIRKALATPEVDQRLRGAGLQPYPTTPQQMKAAWLAANDKWPPMIRRAGISLD